jgi:hypothetical protein
VKRALPLIILCSVSLRFNVLGGALLGGARPYFLADPAARSSNEAAACYSGIAPGFARRHTDQNGLLAAAALR